MAGAEGTLTYTEPRLIADAIAGAVPSIVPYVTGRHVALTYSPEGLEAWTDLVLGPGCVGDGRGPPRGDNTCDHTS